MFNIFNKSANIKSKIVNNQKRFFDRTYYIKTSYNNNETRDYESFANDGYIKNVIVHRCIDLIIKNGSNIRQLFYNKNVNGDKVEINANHLFYKIINKPNPTMSYADFMQTLLMHLLISGNAYLQIARDNLGTPAELYLLRPDRVKINTGNSIIPHSYLYKVDSFNIEFFCDQKNGTSDILHIKLPNPLNDWYGLSPIEAAQYSVQQHNECLKWNKALLENGARPSGALVVKNTMTDENYNRLKEEMDNKFKGGENAGRMMILEGGLDWKEMALNPKDMEFIETKNSAARDIATALGVPAQLLGIKGDNTYNNMSEARLALWEETILPIMNLINDKISNWFSFILNENLEIILDLDSVYVLAEKRAKLYQIMQQISFIDNNEKRDMMDFENAN